MKLLSFSYRYFQLDQAGFQIELGRDNRQPLLPGFGPQLLDFRSMEQQLPLPHGGVIRSRPEVGTWGACPTTSARSTGSPLSWILPLLADFTSVPVSTIPASYRSSKWKLCPAERLSLRTLNSAVWATSTVSLQYLKLAHAPLRIRLNAKSMRHVFLGERRFSQRVNSFSYTGQHFFLHYRIDLWLISAKRARCAVESPCAPWFEVWMRLP